MESLERKFKGKEAEVFRAIRKHGITKAMKIYGVKTRGSFRHWLNGVVLNQPQFNKVANMTILQRRRYWRYHRQTIMDCLELFGEGFTIQNFFISQDELGELLISFPDAYPYRQKQLAGIGGGEKQKFNLEHRETIMDCLSLFGKEFVMGTFSLQEETLERIVRHNHNRPSSKLTKAGRAELKADTALNMAQELLHKVELFELKIEVIAQGERDNKKVINQLKDIFGKFTEMVSDRIGEAMIAPLLKHLIPVDDSLNLPEAPNPLSIEALIAQGETARVKARR